MSELRITWLDLLVTEKCNMSCAYCFHEQRQIEMDDSTMSDAISFLGPKFAENVVINFFGGEPLLRDGFCTKWMKEIKRRYPTAQFHISTNGTIFSEDFLDVCKENKALIQFSYDGVNQESQRGMSKLVEENIVKYVAYYKPLKIGARLTFTRNSVSTIYDSLVRCYDLGIRKFTHHAELSRTWTDEEFAEYKSQLVKMYDFMKSHDDLYLQFCDCGKIAQGRETPFCAAGKTLLAVSADGKIYPCHRMVKMPEFRLGNVSDKTLNRGKFVKLGRPECADCIAMQTCHPCMAANYEYNGALMEPLRATCEINKIEHSMAEIQYAQDNKDIIEQDDVLRKMLAVAIDINRSNKEILRVLSNEKPAY